jgi:hypothetical protein
MKKKKVNEVKINIIINKLFIQLNKFLKKS